MKSFYLKTHAFTHSTMLIKINNRSQNSSILWYTLHACAHTYIHLSTLLNTKNYNDKHNLRERASQHNFNLQKNKI